jgi:hypothetical protein
LGARPRLEPRSHGSMGAVAEAGVKTSHEREKYESVF